MSEAQNQSFGAGCIQYTPKVNQSGQTNKYPNSTTTEKTKDPGSLPENEMDFNPHATEVEEFFRDA